MSKSKNNKLITPTQKSQLSTIQNVSDTINDGELISSVRIKKLNFKFRTPSQETFWNLIDQNEIMLCFGPAGTGKSYLSVAKAIDLLTKENSKFKRIVITTPAVEADEKLGALPGTVEEKLDPYTYSTFYIFEKILGKRKVEKMMERGFLEIIAFAYMRGINIDNSIVIAEEMQNTTKRQMKTFLTRIGENSKYLISGDLEQSDRYKDSKDSGLYFAIEKLQGIGGIGTFEFKQEDIVRNPLIGMILKRFNGDV